MWPRASSQRSVTLVLSAGGSTRGSLGRTDRMEVWVEETALRRSMVVSRPAWWRWMLKNWLQEQSRQWKGDSSASMVEPQEHRKGPDAQTSEDARGVKGAYGGTLCIRGGAEGVPAVESPARPAEPATRALEYIVLVSDGTGLESSMVETADESVGPALLNETTSGAGSDGPAAGPAGVRNWIRSFRRSSQRMVQSPGSPCSSVVSPPPRKRGWSSGRRDRAEERSSCMPDSSR